MKRLHIPVKAHSLSIGAINTTSTVSRGIVEVTVQSVYDNFCRNLTCLTIPTIADSIPSEVFPRNSVKIPRNIRLADPEFHAAVGGFIDWFGGDIIIILCRSN